MPGGIRRADIDDLEIVDAYELGADGLTNFATGVTVVSTTASTKRIVFSGVEIIHDQDFKLEPRDFVILTGDAAGTYTVDNVINATTIEVVEAIIDSVGGTADFRWPSGASSVGVDPTRLAHSDSDVLQIVLEDLDSEISAGGITEEQHETLDTLVHNLAESSYEEITRAGGQVTSAIVWETSDKLKKIRETSISRSGGQISSIVEKHYDATGTLKVTMTGTVSRSVGGQVETITWVRS